MFKNLDELRQFSEEVYDKARDESKACAILTIGNAIIEAQGMAVKEYCEEVEKRRALLQAESKTLA